MAKGTRFRYSLRNDRYEELKHELQKDFPSRQRYTVYEAHFYLKSQGYNLPENEIIKMGQKLYNLQEEFFSGNQIIGIYARLNVDEQVEVDLKKMFDFFAQGEEYITAQQLKSGLLRIGQSLKERDINHIFIDFDLNYNGYINFEAFLEAILRD